MEMRRFARAVACTKTESSGATRKGGSYLSCAEAQCRIASSDNVRERHMNRILFELVLSLALTSLAACASHPPPDTAVSPIGGASNKGGCAAITEQTSSNEPAPTANSLRLITIEPIAGSHVQKSTVLVADLAFAIKDFDSGKYILFAQFDTTTPNRTTDGTFNSYPPLKFASGSYHLCFPIADIWSAPGVKRPLSVHFLLNKIDDAHHNHAIAITDRLSYPTD
jgi:hypothetical protein